MSNGYLPMANTGEMVNIVNITIQAVVAGMIIRQYDNGGCYYAVCDRDSAIDMSRDMAGRWSVVRRYVDDDETRLFAPFTRLSLVRRLAYIDYGSRRGLANTIVRLFGAALLMALSPCRR